MARFNEDTRVKIPAIIQLMRLGYDYQSLKNISLHKETRIDEVRFTESLERINHRTFTREEVLDTINQINTVIGLNDLGKAFYMWLINPQDRPRLIDFENIENNDFSVVSELTFGKDGDEDNRKGSFRPDIVPMINGMPLTMLEVKHPDNTGGIQVEFNRMVKDRLARPECRKYFNMFQVVAFSNNMEYEDGTDEEPVEEIKAGSFYTTPNGKKTRFQFFRDDQPKNSGFIEITDEQIKDVLTDNGYSAKEAETVEFRYNLSTNTPCNKFITSLFDKERILFLLQNGIVYVNKEVPEKHIARYQQFFAARAVLKRVESGMKSGTLWHNPGAGKTELASILVYLLSRTYAKKGVIAEFYYIVDQLSLLVQVSMDMAQRGLNVINVNSRREMESRFAVIGSMDPTHSDLTARGEITVVNVQKFSESMPVARNEYGQKVQRIFFVDEAQRSYREYGEYFKNLMTADRNGIFIAMTGTPQLTKAERTTLKFGGYIHKYFYDQSIADGCTLRIKREIVATTVRSEFRQKFLVENPKFDKDDVYDSEDYVKLIAPYIMRDFINFRLIHNDPTLGCVLKCRSNKQARLLKKWFDENCSNLRVGLVIGEDEDDVSNKQIQTDFKNGKNYDLLIVNRMLTTGYDVDRLKKLYLLGSPKEHTLLQTICRVNRPYVSPNGKPYRYGYIMDFSDIGSEYRKTMNMYLEELRADVDDEENDESFAGLMVDVDTFREKYKNCSEELADMVDTDNLERFRKQISNMKKSAVLKIRKLLEEIKECYTEFRLSDSDEDSSKIDIDRIKELIKITQSRIDFLNIQAEPLETLKLLSGSGAVSVIYDFIKTKVEVLNMTEMVDVMKRIAKSDSYQTMAQLIKDTQKEIKSNSLSTPSELVSLEDALKSFFARLGIIDLDSASDELRKILEEAKRLNKRNDELVARYRGNKAIAKTYLETAELHQNCNKEDVAQVFDVICDAVQNVDFSEILELQSRESFISSVEHLTAAKLVTRKLYGKLALKNWYNDALSEVYLNLKTA